MKAPLLFLAALVAGVSYMAGWDLNLPDWAAIAWKGAGVGLLAAWAARQGDSTDHRLLAVVLTLGAAADMVLEVAFAAGAAVFAVGHVVAILLYLRNRRPGTGLQQAAAGLAFVVGNMAFAYLLASREWAPGVAVYTLFLASMVAAALMSRFAMAAFGALLFLASDLLIFAEMDSLSGVAWSGYAIWSLYFAGQALIAWGVASGLRDEPAR